MDEIELRRRLGKALQHFWRTRQSQTARGNKKDYGARSAVVGGKHLDGFIDLVRAVLVASGIQDGDVYRKRRVELPGYFRPTKQWDLIVATNGTLLAAVEFKSHTGSFGNNVNNRVEEALGNATDLWTAYREGAFGESQRPWLGYFMLLEHAPRSTMPVMTKSQHFAVFSEFKNASYAERYQLFCQRLMRERLYDGACLLLSNEEQGMSGDYSEPSRELGFGSFIESLTARAIAHVKMRSQRQ